MNKLAITYLNRLSDLVFILARYTNRAQGDVLWGPAASADSRFAAAPAVADDGAVDVTFKLAGRYEIAVARGAGAALSRRGNGPGHHDRVPHDVAHLIVEVGDGLRGGVYGSPGRRRRRRRAVLAGRPAERRASQRRRPPTLQESADMARPSGSPRPASRCGRSPGWRAHDPAWGRARARRHRPALLERLFARYDDFARRWAALARRLDHDGVALPGGHREAAHRPLRCPLRCGNRTCVSMEG